MIERKYGWVPDVPDIRDYKYAPVGAVELKDEVDLREAVRQLRTKARLGAARPRRSLGRSSTWSY